MRALHQLIFLAAASTLAAPAAGQDALANRYTMEKTENGLVRLDTLTGEMAKCTEAGDRIVCVPAADAPDALKDRLSELEDRVANLEKKIDALSTGLPAAGTENFPDDAEIDRALGTMEKFMRRFFGVFKDLAEEFDEPGQTVEPLPNRT